MLDVVAMVCAALHISSDTCATSRRRRPSSMRNRRRRELCMVVCTLGMDCTVIASPLAVCSFPSDATLTFWESWTMAAVSAAFPARMKPTIAVRTIAMRLYVVLDWVSINILEAIARTLGEKSR